MQEIVKQFSELFRQLGWYNLPIAFTLISIILLIAQKTLQFRKQRKLNKNLGSQFVPAEVYRATRYFVPTKFQNFLPEDEENEKQKSNAKKKLIPYFLNNAFNNDKNQHKYHLILADTGLGKTTFLINLYISYKNHLKKFLEISNFYEIKIFRLGDDSKVLESIEDIKEKENVILLLDAFDEDIEAVKNYESRLSTIIDKTKNFKQVLLTCRTQFFPSEHETPTQVNDSTYTEKGLHKFNKIYISIFDSADINSYLRKKFSVFSINKRIKAKKIVEKCPSLTSRPMILYYIDDLLDIEESFHYAFQVYEHLIKEWIIRESNKPGIYKKYGSSEAYQILLYRFSQSLAVNLYKREGYCIPKNEIINNSDLQLSAIDENFRSNSNVEARSKSLLNRSADGKYKFCHKSILEYFLALEMIKNSNFYMTFDFEGMDLAKTFFGEMFLQKLSKMKGKYLTKKQVELYNLSTSIQLDSKVLSNLTKQDLNEIEHLTIEQPFSFDFLHFAYLKNLKTLIIIDELNLFPLYIYYKLLCDVEEKSPQHSKDNKLKNIFCNYLNPQFIKQINSTKKEDLIEILELRECPVGNELKGILGTLNKNDWFNKIINHPVEMKLNVLDALREESILKADAKKLESIFGPVNLFLNAIFTFKEKLPNHEIKF